jgi:ribonuclease HII
VKRIHIGIDENGLGARLGPLIVTAVAARIRPSGTKRGDVDRAAIDHLLDDSKRLVSHKDVRLGEAWARAIVGPLVTTPAAFLEQVGLGARSDWTQLCPSHVQAQCWGTEGEGFTAPDELVEEIQQTLMQLSAQGVELCLLRSCWSCTRVLNRELSEHRHRFIVDLHSMERLILEVRGAFGVPVDAICGKVGGIADYPKFFGPLAGRLYTTLEQSRVRSSYEFAQLGRVTFEQDADARDALVMIASLVGKYLRELFMARIARRYQTNGGGERSPSGYHDPVTEQFVEASTVLRKSRRVPFDCFERRRGDD